MALKVSKIPTKGAKKPVKEQKVRVSANVNERKHIPFTSTKY